MNVTKSKQVVKQKIENTQEFTRETAYDVAGTGTKTAHSHLKCLVPYCKQCAEYYALQQTTSPVNVPGGVQGMQSPADLDTTRVYSLNSCNYGKKSKSRPEHWRAYHPVSQSPDQWRQHYADRLALLKAPRAFVARVRTCAVNCWVANCGACGEQNAAVVVAPSCKARGCPYCSRWHSQQQQRDLVHRAIEVETETVFKALQKTAQIELELENISKKLETQESLLEESRGKNHKNACEYHELIMHNYLCRMRELQKTMKNITVNKVSNEWKWREWTIGTKWDPAKRSEYSVDVMRERVQVVKDVFKTLWRQLSFGGVASAILSIEISMSGHIHGHVLFYGPYVPWKWLSEESQKVHHRAGKVTVALVSDRSKKRWDPEKQDYIPVLNSAIREAVKYAMKQPSVTHAEWIAGKKHMKMMHPEVAANWTVATRSTRLKERFGLITEIPGPTPHEHKETTCPICKNVISWMHFSLKNTQQTAMELGPLWKQRLKIKPPDH